jgi:predicted acetyltransferase
MSLEFVEGRNQYDLSCWGTISTPELKPFSVSCLAHGPDERTPIPGSRRLQQQSPAKCKARADSDPRLYCTRASAKRAQKNRKNFISMSVDSHIEPGLLQDGELTVVFTNFALHRAHRVPTYHFRMVHGETAEDMGRINLRTETDPTIERYAGHIGYSVHEKYRGHHYAARSVILLLPLARWLAVDPIWITCNAENLASRRSCELAGAELIEIVDVPPDYIGYLFGDRQKCRYRLRP